jgi:LAS superfamily LD-carboxypeptidase LdcB
MQQFPAFTPQQLTGRTATHVVPLPGSDLLLHAAVLPSFLALQAAAAAEGIDLRPLSAFRDFARQRDIWNAKCRGQRPLLDRDGRRIDVSGLDEPALIDAVLLWSALPGASRHHWGTDLDVIDAAAVPAGYRVQLLPAEFAAGGPFARLDAWLAEHAGEHGFYRPYAVDRGGVQPEPWHISHGPASVQALSALSVEVLEAALRDADLAAADTVLARLPELHARYVRNVEIFDGITSPSRPA